MPETLNRRADATQACCGPATCERDDALAWRQGYIHGARMNARDEQPDDIGTRSHPDPICDWRRGVAAGWLAMNKARSNR